MKINAIDLSMPEDISVTVNGQCNHASAYIFETNDHHTQQLWVCENCNEEFIVENDRDLEYSIEDEDFFAGLE